MVLPSGYESSSSVGAPGTMRYIHTGPLLADYCNYTAVVEELHCVFIITQLRSSYSNMNYKAM